jgi:hypothetical protein
MNSIRSSLPFKLSLDRLLPGPFAGALRRCHLLDCRPTPNALFRLTPDHVPSPVGHRPLLIITLMMMLVRSDPVAWTCLLIETVEQSPWTSSLALADQLRTVRWRLKTLDGVGWSEVIGQVEHEQFDGALSDDRYGKRQAYFRSGVAAFCFHSNNSL